MDGRCSSAGTCTPAAPSSSCDWSATYAELIFPHAAFIFARAVLEGACLGDSSPSGSRQDSSTTSRASGRMTFSGSKEDSTATSRASGRMLSGSAATSGRGSVFPGTASGGLHTGEDGGVGVRPGGCARAGASAATGAGGTSTGAGSRSGE
jgi:hypothetical protein